MQEALEDQPPDATIVAPPRSSPLTPVPARRRRGARIKAAAKTLLVLAVVAGIGTGLYALSRQVYFLGTNDAGLVTLYRGIPYELPFGINLYQTKYTSGVPAGAIPSTRRKRVLDHEWRGRQDAEDLLRTLERGQLSG
jgi:protein phosphatase